MKTKIFATLTALLFASSCFTASAEEESFAQKARSIGIRQTQQQQQQYQQQQSQVQTIENDKADFAVTVDVDKPSRSYTEGDLITINVKTSKDGYLYLLHYGSDNKKILLIPNKFQKDNTIKAGQTVYYPAKNAGFEFFIEPPFGSESVKAIITAKPLEALNKGDFTQDNATEIGEQFLTSLQKELDEGRAKSIGVRGRNNWASDSVSYTTVAKNSGQTQPLPQQQKPRRWFVGFGVGKYKNLPQRSQLPACPKDVAAMYKLATEKFGVPQAQAVALIDEEVTKINVESVFNELAKAVKRGDEVILYWTGHGGRTSGTREQYQEFLVPSDADQTDPEGTLLFEDPLGLLVEKLKGCKVLFIIDACHSGGLASNAKEMDGSKQWFGEKKDKAKTGDSVSDFLDGKQTDTQNSEERKLLDSKSANGFEALQFHFKNFDRAKSLGQEGLAVIASSTNAEQSWVMKERELSVMTYFIVKGILDGDINTHKEIKSKVKESVEKYVRENYPGKTQTVLEQDDLSPALTLKP